MRNKCLDESTEPKTTTTKQYLLQRFDQEIRLFFFVFWCYYSFLNRIISLCCFVVSMLFVCCCQWWILSVLTDWKFMRISANFSTILALCYSIDLVHFKIGKTFRYYHFFLSFGALLIYILLSVLLNLIWLFEIF